ncbi:MAG: hypothetical protein SAJ12_22875 [Jaaginema sp. PMC 1079.18]|nr:hypothetical protein [Jaaginema sp. PMC 1080.18]MEC4853834.1 hypothetical protein [Jaaginema sp. PMC 1079.18]
MFQSPCGDFDVGNDLEEMVLSPDARGFSPLAGILMLETPPSETESGRTS